MVQIVPTRVKGKTPKTNLVMVIMVIMGVVEVSKREIKTPMQTKTRAVGTAVEVNTTPRRDTTLLPTLSRAKQGENPAHDCVATTFDDGVFNLTDDHLEVLPK